MDVLQVNEIYQVKDIYEKETSKGIQTIAEVCVKSNLQEESRLVYMPAALVKNFNTANPKLEKASSE